MSWIKMRGNLWDDPRIARICDLTGGNEAQVIGSLYWLWSAADQHTEDGVMPGLTTMAIDRKTSLRGFAEALVTIGWLADNPEGVRIVNFEEHNGASAKRRSVDAQRKASVRSVSANDADKTRTDCGQKTPNLGAREDKIREDKKEALAPQATPNKRATRLPDDWTLTEELEAIGSKARDDAGLPPANLKTEAHKFADFWHAKSGKDAAKLDWVGTWRNWCRNARAGPAVNGASSQDEYLRKAREATKGIFDS